MRRTSRRPGLAIVEACSTSPVEPRPRLAFETRSAARVRATSTATAAAIVLGLATAHAQTAGTAVTAESTPTANSANAVAPANGAGAANGSAPPSGGPASSEGAAGAAATPRGPTPTPAPENLDARATPIVELHGYLRTRWELFYNFSLGWDALPTTAGGSPAGPTPNYGQISGLPWFRSPDIFSPWCVADPGGGPMNNAPLPMSSTAGQCHTSLQNSANMRFRMTPEIHPTEWMTVHSQIDVLDNLVLGSTPEGYYYTQGRSVWSPLTAFSNTQIPPTAGFNALTNSIVVKRAWAEITNQTLGQLRIGRMPSHWGLGMLANAGNGFDSDYQSTNDRIMYAARLRPLGLFLAAAWDWPSIGATSANYFRNEPGQGQPYDLGMADNVYQWVLALGRRMEPDAQRAALSRNEVVINGGAYLVYRMQPQSGEGSVAGLSGSDATQIGTQGNDTRGYGETLVPRNAQAFIGDLWLQLLGRNFRIEAEAAYIRGGMYTIDTTRGGSTPDRLTISQFGAALEVETRWLNNRLRVDFKSGYASGDPEFEGLNYANGLRAQRAGLGQQMLTLFRFHPDYRIDLIFWRQIQQQFSGAYYFRPGVQYNFIADPNGDLFFGRVDVIWSRASEFVSTRGNHADLGVEIDATVQYQSNYRRDPNDSRAAPGFYAMLQYGVFFPMAGNFPTDPERMSSPVLRTFTAQTAQTVRGVVGVQF